MLVIGHIEQDMTSQTDLEAEESQIADSELINIVAELGDHILSDWLDRNLGSKLDSYLELSVLSPTIGKRRLVSLLLSCPT